MNAAIKAKWCEALRSGKYKQGKEYLKKDDLYCCLGVLAVTCGRETNEVVCEDEELLKNDFLSEVDLSNNQQNNLAAMNDSGVPFVDIATYIEKEL